jgi:hypothetical protein
MGFFGVKKRHPYPSGQRSYGAKAIIEKNIDEQRVPVKRLKRKGHNPHPLAVPEICA